MLADRHTDGRTDTQTDRLIAILRSPIPRRSKYLEVWLKVENTRRLMDAYRVVKVHDND